MSTIEFSHPFETDKLGPNPKRIHLEASAGELGALSKRFELTKLDFFKGQAVLKRLSGKKIECHYQMSASLIQQCVVTFKPIQSQIELDFKRVYDGSIKKENEDKEIEIDIEDTDELDPIIDGVIDIAAAVAEELALEINPFPRADDTDFTEIGVGPDITEEEVKSNNPFSVLAELKKKSE